MCAPPIMRGRAGASAARPSVPVSDRKTRVAVANFIFISYQAKRMLKRNVRSSMPSRPVFAIPNACMNEPLLMLFVGLEWCGVFARLKASPRTFSWKRSDIEKLRSRPRSVLIRPGPHRLLVPQVPKRPAAGGANADLSYHCKMLFSLCGGLTQSANCDDPTAFKVVFEAVTVNGVPVRSTLTLLICHPPRAHAPRPLRNQVLFLPKGESALNVKPTV